MWFAGAVVLKSLKGARTYAETEVAVCNAWRGTSL